MNFPRALTITFSCLAAVVGGCRPKQAEQAQVKEWSEPTLHNAEVFARAKQKTPLLLFYANESQQDEIKLSNEQNLSDEKKLLRILENKQNYPTGTADQAQKLSLKLKQGLFQDMVAFNKATVEDDLLLEDHLCGDQLAGISSDRMYVNFQNYYLLASGYPIAHFSSRGLLGECGWRNAENLQRFTMLPTKNLDKERRDLGLKLFTEYPYNNQPLANVETFEGFLRAVAKKFPASEYAYILVTTSHGHPDKIVTTKISVDVDKLERQVGGKEIVQAFLNKQKAYDDMLDKEDESGPFDIEADSYKAYENINQTLVGAETKSNPNARIPDYGISKSAFFQTLKKMQTEAQMDFPVVILQACNSNPKSQKMSKEESQRVAQELEGLQNVGYIFSSDNGLKVKNSINYAKFFAGGSYFGSDNLYDGLLKYMLSVIGKKEDL